MAEHKIQKEKPNRKAVLITPPLYSLYECPIQREGLPVLCIQWWCVWAAGSAPNWLAAPETKR